MIRKIFAKGDALPQADEVIDVNGEMTVPGFVDVHCHGKSGVDFSDATDEAMTTIGIDKLKEGVTTFLPTTLTLPEEQLAKSLRTAANYVKNGVQRRQTRRRPSGRPVHQSEMSRCAEPRFRERARY